MNLEIFVVAVAALNLAVIVHFLRQRRLLESFALLWIGVGMVGLLLAVGRPLFDRLARALGIKFGTSLLFTAALLFLLVVCMYLSLHISKLVTRTEMLAEEVAFLRGVRRSDVGTSTEPEPEPHSGSSITDVVPSPANPQDGVS